MESNNSGGPAKRKLLDTKRIDRSVRKIERVSRRHTRKFVTTRLDSAKAVASSIVFWLAGMAVLVASVGFMMFWGDGAYQTKAYVRGGLYVEGVAGTIDTLDPLYATTSAEQSAARLMFSSLYDYDRTGTLRPDLATGMTIDDATHKYTVTLRDGAKWHDGEQLTAADVVFTIDLIKNPDTRATIGAGWTDVEAKALDSTTVEFTLPSTYAAFPQALTFPVLPQHLLQDVPAASLREATFGDEPVGSGPFKFHTKRTVASIAGAAEQKVVHMDANLDYYLGRPLLSRFELHAYPDEASLIAAVNNGQLNGAADISAVGASQVTRKNYSISSLRQESGVYLILNLKNDLLKDKKVRQALQLGLDTSKVREALGDLVYPLYGPLTEGQVAISDDERMGEFDLEQAGELLDQAGWKLVGETRQNEAGEALKLTVTTSKSPEYDKAQAAVVKQWRKLGVDVHARTVDTSSTSTQFTQEVVQGRGFDVLLYRLTIGGDPDVYAYWHSSQTGATGYNLSGYSNDVVDANLLSARTKLDQDLRDAKYLQFVRQWQADIPAIPLYRSAMQYVSNDKVRSVGADQVLVSGVDRYADILDWATARDTVYKTP